MTQLSITSPVPQGPGRLSPPEKATRERRGRDSRSRTSLIRDQAEAAARELHPDADRVLVNASHTGGPIVEVFKGREMLGLYRYGGYEL